MTTTSASSQEYSTTRRGSIGCMRFARYIFTFAGIWGLVVLTPLYFNFDLVGRLYPPPVTHPDFFYGFIGVATAWQFAFLSIGPDPIRLQAR
jgi:uncharacterized membrane protein YuzA (DUF378 family)